jgi:hypothetical protein
MDPFRDELAAAHAKIAKLEADLGALKEERSAPTERSAPKSLAERNFVWFVAGIVFCVAVAAAFLSGKSDSQVRTRERDEEFRELATHPPPAPDLFPPTSPGSTGLRDASSCTCPEGDPLCGCP